MIVAPIVALSALLGCPKGAPVDPVPPVPELPIWFAVDGGKPACVAMGVSPPEADTTAKAIALAQLLTSGQAEAAQALVATWPEPLSPALRHARALLGLFNGQPEAAAELAAFGGDHLGDACATAMGALGAAALGDMNGASAGLLRARSIAPQDAHLAFLSFWVGLEAPAELKQVLEAGLAADPAGAAFQFAVGVIRHETGDESGLALVERSVDGGMPEGIGLLLPAYREMDRRGDYLRLAGKVGLLGEDRSVAEADDPEMAYLALLGLPEGHTFEATFQTSLGSFVCTLFPSEAPVAVAAFVGLARGTRPWRDPRDGSRKDGPLYDGTPFHRVIPGFMVQGGDPLGDGSGGPGFRFLDEVDDELVFDRPGRLALANAGPNSNGSQFFVTEVPIEHLNGKHTIFGDCPTALPVVQKIAGVARDAEDRPREPVLLQTLTLRAIPTPAVKAVSVPDEPR